MTTSTTAETENTTSEKTENTNKKTAFFKALLGN